MKENIPHNYYPRPSLVRDSFICLNGVWEFAYSEKEVSEYGEKILVPFPPESKLSGIARTHTKKERLYYRRTFIVPKDFIKDRLILHFGAVDQVATVILNGTVLGTHEGGYTPFSFDITEILSEGENELSVICEDALLKKYPYGKQKTKRGGMWYTPVSGIWQSVWLESLPKHPIKKIKITQSMSETKILVDTDTKNLTLTLLDCNEKFTSENGEFVISPKEPKLWTPENPYLYRFRLESINGSCLIVDIVSFHAPQNLDGAFLLFFGNHHFRERLHVSVVGDSNGIPSPTGDRFHQFCRVNEGVHLRHGGMEV